MLALSLPESKDAQQIISIAAIKGPEVASALADLLNEKVLFLDENPDLAKLVIELRQNSPEARRASPILDRLTSTEVTIAGNGEPAKHRSAIRFELQPPEEISASSLLKKLPGIESSGLAGRWDRRSARFAENAPSPSVAILVTNPAGLSHREQEKALKEAGLGGFASVVQATLISAAAVAKASIAGLWLGSDVKEWDEDLFLSSGSLTVSELTLLKALREGGVRVKTGVLGIDNVDGILCRLDHYIQINPSLISAFGAPL